MVEQEGEIEFPNDIVVLIRVHDDRFGDWFDPPEQHLGQDLTDTFPVAVAELGADYLERMLSEATALPD